MKMLNENLNMHIKDLLIRYPSLEKNKFDILEAFYILKDCFTNGNKLLIAGNGGSSADSEHIVGEMMKGFKLKRCIDDSFGKSLIDIDEIIGNELSEKLQKALPSISLSNHYALNTAYSNDVDGDLCFAQQVNGYGNKDDVFLAITTSGNSKNIICAAITAKAKGMKVIGLTGKTGGALNKYADVNIIVSLDETYMIQELHLPIYHCLCLMLEDYFFREDIDS